MTTTTAKQRPNIPRAKRAGLDLELAAICAAGPGALEADDRYRLKTYGICAQRQTDRFMIRMRVAGGRLSTTQVATATQAAHRYADGTLHLTTRQNLELHSVELRNAALAYDLLGSAGLAGRSACGHTVRNVMACPESATSIEEPYDVLPDAQRLSRLLVSRSSELNVALPSRINIVLGGCTACGRDALTNDIGLVAQVQDDTLGYQVWAGGSLGSAPRLSLLLRPFVPRHHVWPVVWAIIEWFCREGTIDQVAHGRLKFLIEERGEAAFRQAFEKRLPELLDQHQPPLEPVAPLGDVELANVLALAPPGGWGGAVRPQREAGRSTLTVRVPLGDISAADLQTLAALSPDGTIYLSREQNVVLRSVPIAVVPKVLDGIAGIGLALNDGRAGADIRACPGTTFCPLALTSSQHIAAEIETALNDRPDLPRGVSIAVSGCPNSCVKQQAADVGLVGTKFRLDGRTELGYELLLGADLGRGSVGEPVLKLLETEVPTAIVATLETWASTRRSSEPIAETFRRIGLSRISEALARRLRPIPDRHFAEPEPV